MNEQILKNIWNNLTQAGLTTNDFETWSTNFQSNEEVQANVHEYLVGQQLTTNDFSTWSNNLGLKKKDESDFISEEEVSGRRCLCGIWLGLCKKCILGEGKLNPLI